ncbi:MAG: HNH endonuclease signature motif containing protein [Opitutaceae bacterium]
MARSIRLLGGRGGLDEIGWTVDPVPGGTKSLFAAGGFISVPGDAEVLLRVVAGEVAVERPYQIGDAWARLGVALDAMGPAPVRVSLLFSRSEDYVDVWGLAAGTTEFPVSNGAERPAIADLNEVHLLPETLYLDHNSDLPPTLVGFNEVAEGAEIALKKCSYCGRLLPVGPGAPGGLSFHKHNAKVSGHQNECRSCKKWRINNAFNPLRTPDQLNESSVITRERRLLLRENEILQSIKEREGRGLKSIVWDRFDRQCFYCDKPLELKEVELDHTRPLAYLWAIDEYATCLCSEHNNHKKDRFPVDFYTQAQLVRLSQITGLPLDQLQLRSVCEPQLDRIRSDIAGFAEKADPRAFNAIARKVIEFRPDVDLWGELKGADATVYERVWQDAQVRPEQVGGAVEDIDNLLDSLEE